MTEAISALGLASGQAVAPKAPADSQASAIDMRAFQAALNRQGAGEVSAGAAPAEGSNAVQATTETSGGMRAMLSFVERMDNGADSIKGLADKVTAAGGDFTPSQMIELTMQCQHFVFQTQLTSNVANRTSDGIQQLFRQQS